MYVLALCFVTATDLIVALAVCGLSYSTNQCNQDLGTVVQTISVTVIALLFGLFTMSIVVTQLHMVGKNTSTIDQKNDDKLNHGDLTYKIPPPSNFEPSSFERVSELMGKPGFLHLLWLVPVSVPLKVGSPDSEISQFYL